jgi:hypothetical protein
MPSLKLKVNFKKGWPNPSIVEKVLSADAANAVPLEAGFIVTRNATADAWALGVPKVAEEAFILRNDQDDPDAARGPADTPSAYTQANWGGLQGISLQNPLEIETTQYAGAIAIGDRLGCSVHDGKLYAVADKDGTPKAAAGIPGYSAGDKVVAVGTATKPASFVANDEYIEWVPLRQFEEITLA